LALILASGSSIRRKMLEDAGLEFEVQQPVVDETPAKEDAADIATIALRLAEAKAADISRVRPGEWVIGADSVVAVDGKLFSKPGSRDEAAEHLRYFSGKPMLLTSAVALARDGKVEWQHVGRAELQVRELSDQFIQTYLDAEWPEVAQTVGVFRMEGRGIQLFEGIGGGHFTILGMPLIPLLKALRERGLLQS
jgi:septum formation protein